uniref:Uncharacterized protein n=1 Tax=Anguilla anguilla TaxID=7936 RepID=A0A0E9QY69_ANGAN
MVSLHHIAIKVCCDIFQLT